MDRKTCFWFIAIFSFVAGIGYLSSVPSSDEKSEAAETAASYIVQGQSMEVVATAVRSVNGLTNSKNYNGVAAILSADQHAELWRQPGYSEYQ